MPEESRSPTVFERLCGAWLAFKTKLSGWEPRGECPFCGATVHRKYLYDENQYKTRCLNCGAVGSGGPVTHD